MVSLWPVGFTFLLSPQEKTWIVLSQSLTYMGHHIFSPLQY